MVFTFFYPFQVVSLGEHFRLVLGSLVLALRPRTDHWNHHKIHSMKTKLNFIIRPCPDCPTCSTDGDGGYLLWLALDKKESAELSVVICLINLFSSKNSIFVFNNRSSEFIPVRSTGRPKIVRLFGSLFRGSLSVTCLSIWILLKVKV